MQPLELRLRTLRKLRGLSQAELAGRVGVSQATIAHRENGDSQSLRLETIDQLCRALRCSPGELIERRRVRRSNYERRLRSELTPLQAVVAARDEPDKRAQIDLGEGFDNDVRAHKATMRVLNAKIALDVREGAQLWLADAIGAAERGATWKAATLAYEAGFHNGLVWGQVFLRMNQFSDQRDFGSRRIEGGARRGRPVKATNHEILDSARAIRNDLMLTPRELKTLSRRLGYENTRRFSERLNAIRESLNTSGGGTAEAEVVQPASTDRRSAN